MILSLDFGKHVGIHTVELAHVHETDYAAIESYYVPLLQSAQLKAREAVCGGFIFALGRCPAANPSDLWHHVLYRIYIRQKTGTNPEQSWVRVSGEGFELALDKLYNPVLNPKGIRLVPLLGRQAKADAARRLGIEGRVGTSKVDTLIEAKGAGSGINEHGFGAIGGLHVKASLAERVSDDIPTSRIMMAEGLLSILVTLDVKSFPPPHGDLVNRGELGTPDKPSDKRQYIETHGDFSACFSFNLRSVPSGPRTASGRRVFVEQLRLNPGEDAFTRFLSAAVRKR